MKKLKLFTLGVIMCLSLTMLTGCGSNDKDNDKETTDNAEDRDNADKDDADRDDADKNDADAEHGTATAEPSATGNIGTDIVDTVDDVGTDIVDGVTDVGDDLTGNGDADNAAATPDSHGTMATAQP